MFKSSIELDYQNAVRHRKTLHDSNHLDISTLQKLPKFFNWINCEPAPDIRFQMYLAGADDGVALRFFWNGGYEKYTTKLWSRYASNSINMIIDVGAHTGVYTLSALAAGGKVVVSFEPHFMNFSRLLMNLRGNGFSTGGAFMLGVGEAPMEELLSIPTNLDYLSTGGRVGAREGCINFPVSLVALDLFVDPERHKVDLLKIDVEGHEAKVLLGGISLIKKYKPVIFFECLSDDAGLAVSSILEPIGYKFWMVDDLREVTVPIPQLKAELDSNGAIIMSRLNRIASCSMLKI